METVNGTTNFILSFNAVMPMFLLVLLGMFIRRLGVLGEDAVTQFNRVVFTVFLPTLLFHNAYTTSVGEGVKPGLVVFTLVSILAVWLLATLFVCMGIKESTVRGAMIQGIFRSNFLLFGVPLVTNLYGAENISVTVFMVGVVVPIFNVLAVVTLEIFRGNQPRFLNILLGILKNPLILGICTGALAHVSGLQLPRFLESTISGISDLATPMALIMLGAALKFQKGDRYLALVSAVVGKLVLVPLLTLPVAILLGFRGVALATLTITFASPTAVASYTMAKIMDSDDVLAAKIVVTSTFFSSITIFLWIFVLKQLALI
jgi:predicted permease